MPSAISVFASCFFVLLLDVAHGWKTLPSSIEQQQAEALRRLFISTRMSFSPSREQHNWFSEFHPVHYCYFRGIRCDREKYVVTVDVQGTGLSGTLPRQLDDLPRLRHFNAEYNTIGGPLPHDITSLSNLRTLNLGHNQFTGCIPSEFGGVHNLKHLLLHNNLLRGDVPTSLCGSKLDTIDLSENSLLCGHIPSCLGKRRRSDVTNLVREKPSGLCCQRRSGHGLSLRSNKEDTVEWSSTRNSTKDNQFTLVPSQVVGSTVRRTVKETVAGPINSYWISLAPIQMALTNHPPSLPRPATTTNAITPSDAHSVHRLLTDASFTPASFLSPGDNGVLQSSSPSFSPAAPNTMAGTPISSVDTTEATRRTLIRILSVVSSVALVACCALPVLAIRRGLRRWIPLVDEMRSGEPDLTPEMDETNASFDQNESNHDVSLNLNDERDKACCTKVGKKYRYAIPTSLSPIPDIESPEDSYDSSSIENNHRSTEGVGKGEITSGAHSQDRSINASGREPTKHCRTESPRGLKAISLEEGGEWHVPELAPSNDSISPPSRVSSAEEPWKLTPDDLSAVPPEVSVVPMALNANAASFLRSIVAWTDRDSKPSWLWKKGQEVLSSLGIPATGPSSGSLDSSSSHHSRTPILLHPPCIVVNLPENPVSSFPDSVSSSSHRSEAALLGPILTSDGSIVGLEAGVPNKVKTNTFLLGRRKWLKVGESLEDDTPSSSREEMEFSLE